MDKNELYKKFTNLGKRLKGERSPEKQSEFEEMTKIGKKQDELVEEFFHSVLTSDLGFADIFAVVVTRKLVRLVKKVKERDEETGILIQNKVVDIIDRELR